jgi:hypothetical protein
MITALRTRARPMQSDRGSLSLFFVVAAIALLVLVGLVVDGGGKLTALERANDFARQAARQGAEAVQAATAIRGGGARIDTGKALTAAQNYLTAAGVQGSAQVTSGTQLEVDTTTSYKPVFMNIVGVGTQTVHGHATVNLQTGGA